MIDRLKSIICEIRGHQWVNHATYVPVRAGPLFSTVCDRCGEIGRFPDNRPYQRLVTYEVKSINTTTLEL